RLRELQATLDAASADTELTRLADEWEELVALTRTIVDQHGHADEREELRTIESQGRDAMRSGDVEGVRLGIDRLRELAATVQQRQPGWWIGLYQHLVERRSEMTDQATAAFLLRQGRAALERG